MGWGDSFQALEGSSKSFSGMHAGAGRARCEHGLAGRRGAGPGPLKHWQRGLPAAALGLRWTAAHPALSLLSRFL